MPTTAERIVINTGPLVALSHAEALDAIGLMPYEFICPPQIRAELEAGEGAGHVVVVAAWLTTVPLEKPLDPVAATALDSGEAAVVQLALEQGIRRVCIDERRGRQFAMAVGLEVVGALGLLLRAKRVGLIDTITPFIDRLRRAGEWYSAALLRRVLDAAGE